MYTAVQLYINKLIICRFTYPSIEKLNIGQIILHPSAWTTIPASIRQLIAKPMVGWYYPQTLGQILFNYKAFALKNTFHELRTIANGTCFCQNRPEYQDYIDPHHKHIITSSCNIVKDKSMRILMDCGTKYKISDNAWKLENTTSIPNDFLNDIFIQSLFLSDNRIIHIIYATYKWTMDLIDKVNHSSDYSGRQIEFNDFKDYFRQVTTLLKGKASTTPPLQALRQPKFNLRAAKKLRSKFIITYVDKFASRFLFICKKFYAQFLLTEFDTTDTYTRIDTSPEELSTTLINKLTVLGIPPLPPIPQIESDEENTRQKQCILSYPCIVAKLHKNPTGFRIIACQSKYELLPLAQWINRFFTFIMDDLEKLWITTLKDANISPFPSWICTSSREIKPLLNYLNRHVRKSDRSNVSFQTMDFSKMYTNINLQDLKSRIHAIINRVFNARRAQYVRLSTDPLESKWSSVIDETQARNTHKYQYVDKLRFFVWFDYLVDHIYLRIGDKIFRQIIGIPMGTNPAVFIANIYCFTYELEFIMNLIEREKLSLLQSCRFVKRYIDDLLSANAIFFAKLACTPNTEQITDDINSCLYGLTGIYPPCLTVNLESEGKSNIAFLDVLIQNVNDIFIASVYDKREHPPMNNVEDKKFPALHSLLADSSKYGIVTSQFHRFFSICSRKQDFIYRCRQLIHYMLQVKGYKYQTLKRYVYGFLSKFKYIYGSKNISSLQRQIFIRLNM